MKLTEEMIEGEALDTRELTKIFPKDCLEFLSILKMNSQDFYLDDETLNGNKEFLNNVINDQFIPDYVPILGCITKRCESWIERRILFKINKRENDTSDYLADALFYLGKRISRLGKGNYGIQDFLTTESDGYFILVYGLEEI